MSMFHQEQYSKLFSWIRHQQMGTHSKSWLIKVDSVMTDTASEISTFEKMNAVFCCAKYHSLNLWMPVQFLDVRLS